MREDLRFDKVQTKRDGLLFECGRRRQFLDLFRRIRHRDKFADVFSQGQHLHDLERCSFRKRSATDVTSLSNLL